MSIFWAMHHGQMASSASAEALSAGQAARRAGTKVGELEARCDRAMLVCEALWTLLRDKLGVTEEELVNRVNEIDLSDGRLDGKVRRGAVNCPKCKRTVARRFPKCVYCGHTMEHDPFSG